MTARNKKLISFLLLAIFIVSLVLLLFFISPEEIVSKIGVKNVYLLAFIVSFFGGFSAGGSVSFISLLVVLVVGGANPIYLALVSGSSLTIGDIIMFYTGSKGRELVSTKWDKKIKKLSNKLESNTWLKRLTPLLAYAYMGFAPLPNDVLILFLAAIKYSRKKMISIIILGDLTFALVLTLLAHAKI